MSQTNTIDPMESYLKSEINAMEDLVSKMDQPKPVSTQDCDFTKKQSTAGISIDSFTEDESTREVRWTPRSFTPSSTLSGVTRRDRIDRSCSLSAHLKISQQEMQSLLRSNAVLRNRNIVLAKEAHQANRKYEALKDRLRALRVEVHRKPLRSNSNERLSGTAPTSQRECNDKDVALRALQSQIEQLTTSLRRSEQHVTKLSSEAETARKSVDTSRDTISLLEADKRSLEESVKYLNSELEYLTSESDRSAKAALQSLADLEAEKTVMSDQLSTISSRLLEVESECNKYRKSNETLTLQLRECQRELCSRKSFSTKQNRMVEELSRQLNLVKSNQGCDSEELNGLRQSARVYLGRIRKQADKIRQLEDHVFELEKRELIRAPVHVRRRRSEESETPRAISPVESST